MKAALRYTVLFGILLIAYSNSQDLPHFDKFMKIQKTLSIEEKLIDDFINYFSRQDEVKRSNKTTESSSAGSQKGPKFRRGERVQ